MAEHVSSPKPLQLTNAVDPISSNPTNPNLSSSPSVDIPQISSPQVSLPQTHQIGPNPNPNLQQQHQQLQAQQRIQQQQAQQQNLLSPTSNFQIQQSLQRSGSMTRMNQVPQQYSAASSVGTGRQQSGMYGQVSISGAHIQQQLNSGGMPRAGMMGQTGGHLPMLPGQAQFNMQSQLLGQPRQKTNLLPNPQFHAANSPIQTLGMMNSLGLSSQLRSNGPLAYAQQRMNSGQIRQQLSQQSSLPSPQKLQAHTLPRVSSLASINPQLSSMSQNGQTHMMQNSLAQQQWMKQMSSTISNPSSPSYQLQQQQRQQQVYLQQQISSSSQLHKKSLPLNQQQMAQLVQSTNLGTQQQFHHHQQQSPRLSGSAIQRSTSLPGLEPDIPSGLATLGGSSSQGTEPGNQILGKRKIQDLVSQIDSRIKLDPEVEDLFLELADDFIDSVTTFACNLAKHRKSSTLESKDLLLHLERNLHLTIPGFTNEERKYQRKAALSESSHPEATLCSVKDPSRQVMTNSFGMDYQIKFPQSSEQLVSPSVGSQLLHKYPAFT